MKRKTNKQTFRGISMKGTAQVLAEVYGFRAVFVAVVTISGLLFAGISYWIAENQYLPTLWETRPLHLFILVLATITGVLILFRQFDFSYKKPLIMIGVLFAAVVAGIALSRISVLDDQFQKTVYWGKTRLGKTYVVGTVSSYQPGRINIQMEDGSSVSVIYDSQTHFPFGRPPIGTDVRIMGDRSGTVFRARGIRPARQRMCSQEPCPHRKMK